MLANNAHSHLATDISNYPLLLAVQGIEDRGDFAINDGYSQFDKVDIANNYMQQNGVAPTKHL